MKNEPRIRQGNSILFTVKIKEESVKLEELDNIKVLVTSPGFHNVIVSGADIQIVNSKTLKFKLMPDDTKHFKDFVKIEVSLNKSDNTVIAIKSKAINVEHTYISKL